MAIFDQNKVPENYTKNWPATCKKKFLAAMAETVDFELGWVWFGRVLMSWNRVSRIELGRVGLGLPE